MARRYAAASTAALSLLFVEASIAQTYRDMAGTVVPGVVVVDPTDNSGPLFTSSNPGRIAGALSATLTGFQPTPSYSYQSVTMSSAAYSLPTGPVVVFYNTGSSPITVKLGSSSVSVGPGQADIIQPSSWMAFTVGSATYYAVIGNAGSSSVVASGGSGLPTGAGGGASGGAVAQGGNGSAAGAWYDQIVQGGSVVASSNGLYVQPATSATFPVSVSGSVPVTGTFWQATQPVSLTSLPALGAGSNAIGSVSVSNFPATQPVSLASLPTLPAGSNAIGSVNVSNFPATQPVSLSSGSIRSI